MDAPTVPYISADEMRAVDQGMVSICGISMVQMMEHAGRLLAVLAVQEFISLADSHPVVVLVGTGGNGGGGLVCARNLSNWGFDVRVVTSRPASEFWGVTALQFRISQRIGVPAEVAENLTELPEARLIVDAIVGYSLDGAPTGQVARMIEMANKNAGRILSLDVPSGIDATTGEVFEPSIQADATLTLALPKTAFKAKETLERCGCLYLGDIGVPPSLYLELGIEVYESPFVTSSIVRLH
ncbi:MAG: NAD(P)H-hydrate epimerase [Rhodothermales bacterium]|jgi:NAD(P)H-hydrate epimerase